MAENSSDQKVPAVPDNGPADFEKRHKQMTHFPTKDEQRAMDAEWGIDRSLDPTEFVGRFERHIAHLVGAGPPDLITAFGRPGVSWLVVQPGAQKHPILSVESWFAHLLHALMRRRASHQTLDATARNRFNQALQAAYADDSYQQMATIHSEDHMMHSSHGPIGTQRFLPWHQAYLFKLEDLLRKKQPSVTIPYWDYANDHNRPDWVWQPPGVVRDTPGAAGGSLPTQQTIDSILMKTSYTSFTTSLEFDAHNQVHTWCNGTISFVPTASKDPIFWLLHANVDRVWDMWQQNHTGVPSLTGTNVQMDPWWPPYLAASVNDVIDVGYTYG